MCINSRLFRLALLLLIVCCLSKKSHGFCSLEKMKRFAMEACEHLFQQDETRDKRSIDYYNQRHMNRLGFGKKHDKHCLIRRSSFPQGGYLKVTSKHLDKLKEMQVYPPYKERKSHHEKKERYKRDHADSSYNNIPYCCFNRCEEDFFC